MKQAQKAMFRFARMLVLALLADVVFFTFTAYSSGQVSQKLVCYHTSIILVLAALGRNLIGRLDPNQKRPTGTFRSSGRTLPVVQWRQKVQRNSKQNFLQKRRKNAVRVKGRQKSSASRKRSRIPKPVNARLTAHQVLLWLAVLERLLNFCKKVQNFLIQFLQ